MTEAWTPKTADCATSGRTTTNLDGAAPYWTSYTYTTAGQRKTETQHTTTGDKTTTYTYNAPTDNKPHTLDTIAGARTGTYTYDTSGNTISRPGPTAQQTLTWNTEGDLTKLTESTKETGYLYDANGELLIRRAKGDGETILYLGAGTELHLTVKGTTKTVSGTRYYTANGQTIAVRTATSGVSGTKLSFLAADHHGTSSVALDSTTYAVTKRYTTPFGAPRGTKPTSWPDDKAFLGKPADDATGLTHVGAREYDPTLGQFLSVDPLLTLDQHQSLNGYAYANNTPVTSSDPTGEGVCMQDGVCGGTKSVEEWEKKHGREYGDGRLGGGAGTAHTSSTGQASSGQGTQGHWEHSCIRGGICKKHWAEGAQGDDKDLLWGLAQGAVDTVTFGCNFFKLFGSVECASDAMRAEAADHGADVGSEAYGIGAEYGSIATGVAPELPGLRGAAAVGEGGAGAFRPARKTIPGGEYYTPQTPLKEMINPKGGETNCRACVLSVDILLGSGARSNALPALQRGSVSALEEIYGRKFRTRSFSNIVTDMQKAGPGARGIVWGLDKRGGHVFNVVNYGGRVTFLDGQSGNASHAPNWLGYQFMRTK
ncbi:RHS repeat-associated core domain-containing protein [Streptomyces sp. NPDC048521]|uniref:RHS repeat-associated core domain-containing protein n=1 Tax=Streptomyces sp. NPDC048521 TaxID=3365566 RepID=UPI00371ACA05